MPRRPATISVPRGRIPDVTEIAPGRTHELSTGDPVEQNAGAIDARIYNTTGIRR